MFAPCLFVFSAYFERKCTKLHDFQKISSKIVSGLFIMGFSHFLYVIFHFLGPAVVPSTRGPQTSILSRNLRLGSKNWIFSSKLLARTILVWAEKRYAQLRVWKSNHFWGLDFARLKKWLCFQPPSCVYRFSARTKIVRASSLLEQIQFFDPNRKFLDKMLVWGPLVGGTTAGPKK